MMNLLNGKESKVRPDLRAPAFDKMSYNKMVRALIEARWKGAPPHENASHTLQKGTIGLCCDGGRQLETQLAAPWKEGLQSQRSCDDIDMDDDCDSDDDNAATLHRDRIYASWAESALAVKRKRLRKHAPMRQRTMVRLFHI